MKNNKTDSEFFASLKQSLEGYEEEYVPGAWEAFLQMQKRRRRSLYLRISSAVAACLIIGSIGSGYFIFNQPEPLKINSVQIAKTHTDTSNPGKNPAGIAAPSVVTIKSNPNPIALLRMASTNKPGKSKNLLSGQVVEPSKLQVASNDSAGNVSTLLAGVDHQRPGSVPDTIKNHRDTLAVNEMQNKIADSQTGKENINVAAVSKRKIRFGINLSPGISTTQSARSFSYTGGVSADIPLFANVQLSTGLQLENQTIVNKTQSMSFADASSYSLLANSSNPKPIPLNQTETRLINLALPLNITWKFISQKSQSYYVSTGFSSLVYLKQENKVTSYSNQLVPISSLVGGQEVKSYDLVSQASVTQDTFAPDQTFNFAGRLNIILGVERRISERISIHLEPYAKIPVAGLETGSLMNTSSGINFKVSF
jgi:hypothetical protein